MDTPFVLLVGNPVDGLGIVGPFASGDDAAEYADKANYEESWWIAPLDMPAARKEHQHNDAPINNRRP